MDTMILDEIAQDREAYAIVTGVAYTYKNTNFLYAFGDFIGGEDSAGEKAHITEQNIGFEHTLDNQFVVATIFVMSNDLHSSVNTPYDFDRLQFMLKYDF